MAVEGVANGQEVFIDMKTRIISSGPHNGIIVQNGILQGPDIFWPSTLNGTPNCLSPQRLNPSPSPKILNGSVRNDDANERSESCISSRLYPLTDERIILPDEFNVSKKVHLNIFQTNPVMAELGSLHMQPFSESSYKPDSGSVCSKIFNDNVENGERSVTISNYQHSSAANEKKEASLQNIRKESVELAWEDRKEASNTRIYSDVSSRRQSSHRMMTDCEQYNKLNDEDGKYKYKQTEKKFVTEPSLEKVSIVTTDQKLIDESVSVPQQKTIHCGSLEHLPIHNWDYQQLNKSEVPEQLYHLYETQDAFGNPLIQCEMEFETNEQLSSQLPSLIVSKDNESLAGNGLPLIHSHFSPVSNLRDANYKESLLRYLQQYPHVFNDATTLGRMCGSLYSQSAIPLSQNRVKENIVCLKTGGTEKSSVILMDGIESVLGKTAADDQKVLTKMFPAMNLKQLEVSTEKRQCKQELMEKVENMTDSFEKVRNRNMNIDIGKDVPLQRLESVQNSRNNPVKSILHIPFRKSNLRKKVQFPSEQPQVMALEHRLLIDNPDLI
uniref:Uncharacterized protein n=1 Tax=Setaria digitata TaxID=48799 RepID=A0A915PRA7_9BILA